VRTTTWVKWLALGGWVWLAGTASGMAQPSAAGAATASPPAASRADDSFVARLARQAEPGGVGQSQRLEQYLRLFEHEVVRDKRLFAFHVEVSAQEATAGRESTDPIRVSGHVEFAEHRTLLLQFLRQLGFEQLEDEIEILPAADLGEHRYALLRVPHAISYDRAGGPSREAVTECLLAEPLLLLKETATNDFLCHSGEGYVGYVSGKLLCRMTEPQFTAYLAGPRVRILQDTSAGGDLVVRVGTQLKWVTSAGAMTLAQLPTGETIEIPASVCRVIDQPPHTDLEAVIESARQLLGAPYLWGGKSSLGVDCSGLMQVAFAAQGLFLPRDASQQIYLGKLTGTRWFRAGIQRGDTLYFLGPRGNIAHTGIYLGHGEYLEATTPAVTITSLRPDAENYNARGDARFAFAKRLRE
jgi:gamma-D-glutamyl-L-lysine dipeptidyl-peptidase